MADQFGLGGYCFVDLMSLGGILPLPFCLQAGVAGPEVDRNLTFHVPVYVLCFSFKLTTGNLTWIIVGVVVAWCNNRHGGLCCSRFKKVRLVYSST